MGARADAPVDPKNHVAAVVSAVWRMTMATKTRIKANHPVREAFAGCSTGSKSGADRTDYYRTKGHAVNAFDAALQTCDLCLDCNDLADFHGSAGCKTIEVHDELGFCVGLAVLSWFRMESGRYEFVGYLA